MSALVWCCFNWTKCESPKSTTKNLLHPRWPVWAAGSSHDQNGASHLRTGSPWSPGRNLTWWPSCPASTMSTNAAQPVHSPTQKCSLIFLAAKRQQFYTIAERSFPPKMTSGPDVGSESAGVENCAGALQFRIESSSFCRVNFLWFPQEKIRNNIGPENKLYQQICQVFAGNHAGILSVPEYSLSPKSIHLLLYLALSDCNRLFDRPTQLICISDIYLMCSKSKQARKPRSYASSKLRLTHSLTYSLTRVKCRATSVAKKKHVSDRTQGNLFATISYIV